MSSDITFASFVPSAAFSMSTVTLMSGSASFLATPKPTVRASGSTTRCGASMPPTRRPLPVPHDLTTPRARARAARLRANEAAERREDLAAFVTTPAQWALLCHSFAGVKTEFADLDGMSWDAPGAVPVSAAALVVGPGPRRRPSVRGSSASAPSVLALDDSTVRPRLKRKRRLSAPVPWGQGVTSKSRS